MESNVKITFWLFKAKRNQKNEIPIYLRVSYNYANFSKSTGISIKSSNWDKKSKRITGSSLDASTKNAHLEALKLKILHIVNQLTILGKPFNINTIKDSLEGNPANQITLMKVCNEQLEEMRILKASYANSTVTKYANTILRLRQFIKYKYKRSDVYLYELDYQFISEFIVYLQTHHHNGKATQYKHYQRLTRMIHHAMHKGYLEKFPFDNFKIRMPKKQILYLTEDEITRIEELEFPSQRLEIIRDIFIFAVFTGLAYAEVESLTPDNITTGIDGELWLNIHRRKTHKDYQVPLFPKALAILKKYEPHSICKERGRCLPVPSNVKYNAYLKEIATLAKIPKSKPLVSHLARKTFACTIALANGMNIGVLSKILGHSGIQVTLDSYATVIDQMMLNGVKDLKQKLSVPTSTEGIVPDNAQKDLISNILQENLN